MLKFITTAKGSSEKLGARYFTNNFNSSCEIWFSLPDYFKIYTINLLIYGTYSSCNNYANAFNLHEGGRYTSNA